MKQHLHASNIKPSRRIETVDDLVEHLNNRHDRFSLEIKENIENRIIPDEVLSKLEHLEAHSCKNPELVEKVSDCESRLKDIQELLAETSREIKSIPSLVQLEIRINNFVESAIEDLTSSIESYVSTQREMKMEIESLSRSAMTQAILQEPTACNSERGMTMRPSSTVSCFAKAGKGILKKPARLKKEGKVKKKVQKSNIKMR